MIHTVNLTPDDLRDIYQEAHDRDARHEDARNWDIDREQTHIIGLKGEVAFANLYGLSVDLSARPDGDGGVDFRCSWLNDTVTVDVKTTTHGDNPWLCVREDSDKRADRYVLAVANDTEVNLVGFADRQTVIDTPVSDRTGHTTNHIIESDDLRALPDPALINPATDTDDTGPSKTTRRRPPAATFALRTRDTSDEYAESRIKNTDNADYLDAILDKEVARDSPRQQRIAWINQRRREIPDE
jgi:hypothetical protein